MDKEFIEIKLQREKAKEFNDAAWSGIYDAENHKGYIQTKSYDFYFDVDFDFMQYDWVIHGNKIVIEKSAKSDNLVIDMSNEEFIEKYKSMKLNDFAALFASEYTILDTIVLYNKRTFTLSKIKQQIDIRAKLLNLK